MSIGLTERRMLRTREHILATALEMFTERGFDASTVEEIAAAVEISPRTVYRYFSTKEDLVLGISTSGWSSFLDALQRQPAAESLLDAVRGAVAVALAPGWDDGPRLRAFLIIVRDTPSVRARWHERATDARTALAAVIAGREGDRGVALRWRVTAGAITVAINTGLEEWVETSTTRSPAELVDEALSQLTGPML